MRTIAIIFTGTCLSSAYACHKTENSGPTAIVHDTAGRSLGTLTLTETAQGILVSGHLMGLSPGPHGIHLHAVGKCEPPFTSAGGHWNPTGAEHGTQNPKGPHLGDMLNVNVGADSTVTVHTMTPGGTLHGVHALLDADGASIVVHGGPDDYHSNPAGNSGGRIACGVVTGG